MKKEYLTGYQSESWMPHYDSTKEDFNLKLEYTLEKSLKNLFGISSGK